MLISGFTIVRNGIKFDYPFLESIKSLLPICDEYIINYGESDDETRQALSQLHLQLPEQEAKKIHIFETKWPLDDPEKRKGGQILAEQTNLALSQCKGTWCFYLQADEVVHEEDLRSIQSLLKNYEKKSEVEAIVCRYIHFYGSYQVIQTSRSSYRREVRIIRNGLGIESVGDAQSFRHKNGQKVHAALSDIRIFHYGWVRPQEIMKSKTVFMDSLYHENNGGNGTATGNNYQYKKIIGLKKFEQTHPKVMQPRVKSAPIFDFSLLPKVFHIKDMWKLVSGWIESRTGYRLFEYKSYKLITSVWDKKE